MEICYKNFNRNRLTTTIFPRGKFQKHPDFWTCSVRGDFASYTGFFILFSMKASMRPHAAPVSVYEDRLMIIQYENKKRYLFISTTYDDKIVPTSIQEQDLEKPEVVTDYNSRMEVVDLSATYCTVLQKHFSTICYDRCSNTNFVHASNPCGQPFYNPTLTLT